MSVYRSRISGVIRDISAADAKVNISAWSIREFLISYQSCN